jgi:hypothetical protein
MAVLRRLLKAATFHKTDEGLLKTAGFSASRVSSGTQGSADDAKPPARRLAAGTTRGDGRAISSAATCKEGFRDDRASLSGAPLSEWDDHETR